MSKHRGVHGGVSVDLDHQRPNLADEHRAGVTPNEPPLVWPISSTNAAVLGATAFDNTVVAPAVAHSWSGVGIASTSEVGYVGSPTIPIVTSPECSRLQLPPDLLPVAGGVGPLAVLDHDALDAGHGQRLPTRQPRPDRGFARTTRPASPARQHPPSAADLNDCACNGAQMR